MSTPDGKSDARLRREQAQAAAVAAERRNRQLQVLGGVVFAAIVVVILVVVLTNHRDPDTGIGKDKGGEVAGVTETANLLKGVPQHGLTLGDPKAPVTIIEFLDVQCPYCKAHELDEQPTVIRDLIKTGKARLEAQPVALPMMGEDSEAGRAIALRLSRKNLMWNFLNLFYFNQGEEATGYVTSGFLDRILTAIPGASKADAGRSIDAADKATVASIDASSEIQAKKAAAAGVNFGTPWFAIARTGAPAKDFEPVILGGSARNSATLTKAVDELITKHGYKPVAPTSGSAAPVSSAG